MLKSSSLCSYSSNLGTFWLKIEQFWPFEEIPQKPLGQFQPNFCGMILGWPPSKIVTGDPDFQPR
jgi:hypothetical protein